MCNRLVVMAAIALKIADLSVYIGNKGLFSGIDLEILQGDKVTLFGRSGSGKSTLLRCVAGFIPFEGEIIIYGRRLDAQSVWKLRAQLALVAQEPDMGEGTVREVLQRPYLYRTNQHLTYTEDETISLLERMNLSAGFLDKDMAGLSGGEKQRVALVCALLLHRPLLLLDEAASALDPESKSCVRQYLCSRDDLTILSVSHDIRDFSLSETVVDMENFKKGKQG